MVPLLPHVLRPYGGNRLQSPIVQATHLAHQRDHLVAGHGCGTVTDGRVLHGLLIELFIGGGLLARGVAELQDEYRRRQHGEAKAQPHQVLPDDDRIDRDHQHTIQGLPEPGMDAGFALEQPLLDAAHDATQQPAGEQDGHREEPACLVEERSIRCTAFTEHDKRDPGGHETTGDAQRTGKREIQPTMPLSEQGKQRPHDHDRQELLQQVEQGAHARLSCGSVVPVKSDRPELQLAVEGRFSRAEAVFCHHVLFQESEQRVAHTRIEGDLRNKPAQVKRKFNRTGAGFYLVRHHHHAHFVLVRKGLALPWMLRLVAMDGVGFGGLTIGGKYRVFGAQLQADAIGRARSLAVCVL